MYIIAQIKKEDEEPMPDYLVGLDNNVIRFKTETEAYDFLSNLDITKTDLERTSIELLRMH